MPKVSDEQLITNYLKGDEQSLESLIKRYLRLIYGFVYRHVGNTQEAEDITQEVFLKVWRNLKKFDKQKSFKSWVFTIAKNSSLDSIKKKKPILFSEFENTNGKNTFVDNLKDLSLLPDKIVEMANAKDVINLAMKKLSVKYRLVLSLYYDDLLNFREIAEMLGEPLNTIKSRHRRGLIFLKKIFIELEK